MDAMVVAGHASRRLSPIFETGKRSPVSFAGLQPGDLIVEAVE
jgi:hypothetical protein